MPAGPNTLVKIVPPVEPRIFGRFINRQSNIKKTTTTSAITTSILYLEGLTVLRVVSAIVPGLSGTDTGAANSLPQAGHCPFGSADGSNEWPQCGQKLIVMR